MTPRRDPWVDPLRFHDDIRLGVARYRPITTAPNLTEYTIAITGRELRFTGPTLFAATETARLHHQQLHPDSSHPPIYTRSGGRYHWWDEQSSDSNDRLAQRIPLYIAALYDTSVTAITISGPPPTVRRRRGTRPS